jgi:hypothetical protein
MRNFVVTLEFKEGIKSMDFKPGAIVAFGDSKTPASPTVTHEGPHWVDDNQLYPEKKPDSVRISVDCNHNENDRTASWFNDKVRGDKKHMLHTRGGANPPHKMYVAFEGELIINGYNFRVTFGLNSSGAYNRWNLNSGNLIASSDEKEAYLAAEGVSTFKVTTDESDTFRFKIYQ